MLTNDELEKMKSGLFATVDLETVMAQANEQGQGQIVLMTINALLERLKDHTGQSIADETDKFLSVVLACGHHSIEDDGKGISIIMNLREREFQHHFEIRHDRDAGIYDVYLILDEFAKRRAISIG